MRGRGARRAALWLAVGAPRLEADTLVFTDANGNGLTPSVISRVWRRLVVAKGLPQVNFYALRHIHVSILISNTGI
jgi:integrase